MFKNTVWLITLLISIAGYAQNQTDDQGFKQGKWSKNHKNGNLRYEGEFSNNKEIGEFKFYDKNGKLVSTRTYKTPGGIALCKMYNLQGFLHAKGEINGRKKEGEWIFYSNRGQDTVSIENYEHGILHGINNTYFSNGKIASKRTYNKGLKTGAYTEYYKNGQLEQEGKYVNGELEGEVKFWYNTGQLKRRGTYLNGDKTGKWITYDPDGRVREVIDFSKK